MGRPKKHIDEEVFERAREAVGSIKDHLIVIRLQAIISSYGHSINLVAEMFGVDRTTVSRWIQSFKESGIDGLVDKPKGHYPSKLNDQQKEKISRWLEQGVNPKGKPVHWTIEKLRMAVSDEFGVSIGKTPLWLIMRSMGYAMKTPRPRHEKANPGEQGRFKKNSGA